MSLDLNMVRPGYRKLMLHGQQGQAVIVAAKTDRGTNAEGMSGGLFGWKVTIRVKFPDGQVDDFERFIGADDAGVISVQPGDTVPIRLDPDKHRVEIDARALRANRDASRSRQRAEDDAVVRQAEAKLGIDPDQDAPTRTDRRDVSEKKGQPAAAACPPDLARKGVRGRGACVDVVKTSAAGLVDCRLTVGVRLVDGTPPYRATCQVSLEPGEAEEIIPGRTLLAVRADPHDHQRIAISLGEEIPSVEVSDPAVVDPPARAMRDGDPCRVQILAHSDQYLRLPSGEELYATKVRVLDDGSEFQVNLPVPAGAVGLLADDSELPAKRIPYEPGALVIDWAAARMPA